MSGQELVHQSSSRLFKDGSRIVRSENSRTVEQTQALKSNVESEESDAVAMGEMRCGMSVQMVIALLCIIGIITCSASATGLVVSSCDDALEDTRQGGDLMTERCFGTSNVNLKRVVTDLLTYSSGSVKQNVDRYFNSVHVESRRLGGLLKETYRMENKTTEEFMNKITPSLWSSMVAFRNLGINGVGWHGVQNTGAAWSSSLTYDGDTDTQATGMYCGEWWRDPSAVQHQNLTAGRSPCVAGFASVGTGLPGPHLALPVSLQELQSVNFLLQEDVLWNVSEGSVRWTGLYSDSAFLGYSLTGVAEDGSGSVDHLSWIATIELNYFEKYLVDLGNSIKEKTNAKVRIFTVIASSWIAERKKSMGSLTWAEHDQRGYLTGVSDGVATQPYETFDELFQLNTTKYLKMKDVNASDAIISGLATAIDGRYEGLAQYNDLTLDVAYNDTEEMFFVDITRINDSLGLDWWLVTAIDEEYVLAEVHAAELQARETNKETKNEIEKKVDNERVVTYVILILVSVGIVLLSMYVVHLVLRPIIDIQKEMSNVARMELDVSHITPTSHLKEVRKMQRDFAKMIANLLEYRAYVPAALLTDGSIQKSVNAPTGAVTIMFTDIEGSTSLWKKANVGMSTALDIHNDVIRESYTAYNGYEVKTIGDAFMVAFDNPFNAMLSALETQLGLHDQQWPSDLELDDNGLKVRIGLHIGQTIAEINPLTNRSDYRGSTINMASRVESRAKGGTTCITKDLYHAIKGDLPNLGNPVIVEHGTHELKGLGGGHLLYLVAPPQQKARLLTPQGRRGSFTTINVLSDGDQSGVGNDTKSVTSGKSSAVAVKSEAKTPSIQQHVQQKTGLSLSSNQMTVAVCKLIVKERSKIFESYNLMVRTATEAAYATEGVVGNVNGRSIIIIWNGAKKCPMHVTSALRFAAQLETRVGDMVRIGIASGTLLHGNVGTQKKRFATTLGYPLEAAQALADYTQHLNTFCLLCDCTSDHRIHRDPTVAPFIRLLDSWYEESEHRKLLIYDLLSTKLTTQLESWDHSQSSDDPDSEYLTAALHRIWVGDPSGLEDIRKMVVLSDSDPVLKSVLTMHEHGAPCPSEGCRVRVGFSHVPMGAEMWTRREVTMSPLQRLQIIDTY